MNVENLFLYFLACGAATFPLTLSAICLGRSLRGRGAHSTGSASAFEKALTLSLIIWIAGALVFYAVAVQIERRKPCIEQHTNQLTAFCKKELGSVEPDD
jgi:hypothetical protein